MIQEKRWCQRRHHDIQVDIYNKESNKFDMLRCRTRNVSLAGIFLATGGIEFLLYKEVNLVIPPQQGIIFESFKISARIMQQAEHGIGLEFINVTTKTVNLLRLLCNNYGVANRTSFISESKMA